MRVVRVVTIAVRKMGGRGGKRLAEVPEELRPMIQVRRRAQRS